MKYYKNLRILAVALTLALLVALVPATPALAAEYLRLRPEEGEIGDEIEAYGSGFSPGTIKFFFSDEKAYVGDRIGADVINYEELGQKSVGETGSFVEFYFYVPDRLRDGDEIENVRGGTYYVYAADYYKDILARADFTVEAVGEISLDPDEGTVGTEVQITGEGFDDNEDIAVEYDGDDVDIESGDRDTNSDGEFECTIIIPESTAGDHTIAVIGEDSDIEAEADFTVEPKITISPESGAAGTTVTVSGTGFGDEVDLEVQFNNEKVADDETDDDGSFEVTFVVPSIGAGTYDIDVEDDDGNDDEVEFTIAAATVSINPTTGYVNTQVTVSGTGFQASQSVTIYFDNENIATTSTDAYGKVNTSFNVPSRGAGNYTVKVSDGVNVAQADFSITTSASISPETSVASPGYVGTQLTVSGVGFTAGTAVTVTYDGTQVATATVDANGSFTARFNAPASIGGQHTVIASIGTTTETFTFFMDSTAPQWPQPLKPEMGIKAEAEAYFDWDDVTDPSGVTYTLQVATSQDFSQSSIVLAKTGLLQSEYTITEEGRLKPVSEETPYYWRVRAIDGASNEGEWSGTGEFYVGGISWGLPKPVIYTLIGVGVIIIVVLGFWLGRKTAYY